MDPDPMQFVEEDDDKKPTETTVEAKKPKPHLNTWVAIMVALLATFMGICKVKDDNIVQAMQQAQAKSVDAWAWYQAKKTRLQFAQAAVDQFQIQAATASPELRRAIDAKIAFYKKQVDKEKQE